jgi:hypothetical protein
VAAVVVLALVIFVVRPLLGPNAQSVTCAEIGRMATAEAQDVLVQLLEKHDKNTGSYNLQLSEEEVQSHCGVTRWGGGSSRNFNDVLDEFMYWD